MWQIAAAQGIGAGLSYLSARKNRTPGFQKTAYGKLLKERAKTGVYSPGRQRNIISRTGRAAGDAAYQNQQDIRGYLTSRGMENSISGAALMNQPNQDRLKAMAESSEKISMLNEQSKIDAESMFAQGINETDAIKRGEKQQAQQALISNMTGAASGYMQNRAQQQQQTAQQNALAIPENIFSMNEDEVLSWAAMYPDQERARKIVDLWFMRN